MVRSDSNGPDPVAAAVSSGWTSAGALSIVVQGGLFQGNFVETANHCRHWRDLFPRAEIILAISVTDVVTYREEDGEVRNLELVPKHRNDGHLMYALQVVVASCDRLVLAAAALPLPPIKRDTPKLNNMNLQMAAAKRGLAAARGTFVLRIRSDMIFLDRSFLEQYAESYGLERGDAAALRQRVMISWLYTLNPFTLERMPLHFSDWFHFGLTEDVRRIWDAPSISLQDSMYFKTRPHAPGSNLRERQFNTRLAVEQHIILHCFRQLPNLVLEYNNDATSIDLSLDILNDNFVICDLALAHCVFEKYASEFSARERVFHCITREDWLAMVKARSVDYRTTLAHKIRAANYWTGPGDTSFPRRYGTGQLRVKNAKVVEDEIVSTANGLVFYGPYAPLERGRYCAHVNVSKLEGTGAVTLRVTHQGGRKIAAKRKLSVSRGARLPISIAFDIADAQASDVEVLLVLHGTLAISVSGITIAERPQTGLALAWRFVRSRFRS